MRVDVGNGMRLEETEKDDLGEFMKELLQRFNLWWLSGITCR
jgi:hypothetical protein